MHMLLWCVQRICRRRQQIHPMATSNAKENTNIVSIVWIIMHTHTHISRAWVVLIQLYSVCCSDVTFICSICVCVCARAIVLYVLLFVFSFLLLLHSTVWAPKQYIVRWYLATMFHLVAWFIRFDFSACVPLPFSPDQNRTQRPFHALTIRWISNWFFI